MRDGHDELGRDGVTEKILKRVHGPPKNAVTNTKWKRDPGSTRKETKETKKNKTKKKKKKKKKKENQTKGHAMSKRGP